MQPSKVQAALLRRVEEASGKPVLVQSDPSFSGHATVKITHKLRDVEISEQSQAILGWLLDANLTTPH